jgi:hypothetical protein
MDELDSVALQIDNGSTRRHYREITLDSLAEIVHAPIRLQPGREAYTEHLLVFGRYQGSSTVGFPFAKPGEYTVRLSHVDQSGTLAESNDVHVTVDAAAGSDAELLSALGDRGTLLRYGGDATEEWLRSYPNSPLLRLARIEQFKTREARLLDGRDPVTNDSLRASMGREAWESYGASQLRTMLSELLASSSWGPFEDIRLLYATDYARRSGDLQTAQRLANELISRFPRSSAAQQVRQLVDSQPPALIVSAQPASLWPPNHAMTPISVAVQVSDNLDPAPRVTLLSITCDDRCNPAVDIAGASYGTDDRQFTVRSERIGAGAGRTYLIKYSARDAAGNQSITETRVTIAHDQRAR